MNFNKYSEGVASTAPQQLNKEHKNCDHVVDPYIRRYHIVKIALKSMSYGLMVHAGKTMVENMKFYKMSPWLELCVISYIFSTGLYDKFHASQMDNEYLALCEYKRQHFFNSQYHH